MSAAVSANLMGITGIARRLVLDGAMDEASARKAMEAATGERVPLATFIADRKLVQPAALAAALDFLGHPVPPEIGRGGLADFWRWAISAWSIERIPSVKGIYPGPCVPP